MFHLIDGYNVTKRDPATRSLSLQAQREALETRMRTRARELIGTTDYLIVWDGAGGTGVARKPSRKSAFTRLDTADDSIVERVRCTQQRVCVVTSDNGLVDRCKNAARAGVNIKPSKILFEDALMFAGRLSEDAAISEKPHGKGKARSKGGTRSRGTTSSSSRKAQLFSPDIGIPKGANKINEELKKIWGIED